MKIRVLLALVFFLSGSLLTLLITSRYTINISPRDKSSVDNSKNSLVTPAGGLSASIDYLKIKKVVLPDEGFRIRAAFGNLGPKLIEVGAIDLKKFEANFQTDGGLTEDQKEILTKETALPITINEKNATFMVDFFWALGLANKNKILDEGPMAKDRTQLGNFASTGGWTLGRDKAVDLFSRYEIIKLTGDQQKMVEEIVSNVFRPCCGNPTSFPDCNHGMAALGLTEYLASKGFPREEIYRTILYFNSFWFPQNYLDLAAYFQLKGTDWSKVNPEMVLGESYSSGQGYARIKSELDTKTGVQPPSGGSGRGCST